LRGCGARARQGPDDTAVWSAPVEKATDSGAVECLVGLLHVDARPVADDQAGDPRPVEGRGAQHDRRGDVVADQVDAREVELLQHCQQVPRSDVVAHDLGAARALAQPRHVEGHQVERGTQLPPDQLERQQRERQRAEEHHRRPRRVTGLGHAHGPARHLSHACLAARRRAVRSAWLRHLLEDPSNL